MTKNGKVRDITVLREGREAEAGKKVQEMDGEKMECVNFWKLTVFSSVDSHKTTFARREIILGTKKFLFILLFDIFNLCVYRLLIFSYCYLF